MNETAPRFPTIIPGLRSPAAMVNGLVYFGRMIDKIRLHHQGSLPAEWVPYLGFGVTNSFDSRCCIFLEISYEELREEVISGEKTDEDLLQWAYEHGKKPTDQQIEIWNAFMMKRGWRDAASPYVASRLGEMGLPLDMVPTVFEVIDMDEGRMEMPSK